jgi:hypothetical protein
MALDYSNTPDIIKNNELLRGKFSLCEVDPPRKVSIRCIEVTNEQEQQFFSRVISLQHLRFTLVICGILKAHLG